MSTAMDLLRLRITEALENIDSPLFYTVEGKAQVLAHLLADKALIEALDMGESPLDEAITKAKTFYMSSDGTLHRITELPNGHLHNACNSLKLRRLGGLWTFTILAMDAEIARREALRNKEADGDT